MRIVALCGIGLLLVSCSAGPKRSETGVLDSLNVQPPPPPPPGGGEQAPAAIKDNMSLIGGVILDIRLVDDYRYELTLDLRTALPAGPRESLAEPGQRVTVYPAFEVGEGGNISLENARNKRLYEVRRIESGRPILGRITLLQDGKWYLHDTGPGE